MTEFIYDLPYDNTEWGRFYQTYKDETQGKLQKFITHTQKERKEWVVRCTHTNEKGKILSYNPYECISFCKHVFYKTCKKNNRNQNETPEIFIKQIKYSDGSATEIERIRKVSVEVFIAYRKRQTDEFKEVIEFYKKRKDELRISQTEHRKDHAGETIQCPICNSEIKRTCHARHKKSKKCIAFSSTI